MDRPQPGQEGEIGVLKDRLCSQADPVIAVLAFSDLGIVVILIKVLRRTLRTDKLFPFKASLPAPVTGLSFRLNRLEKFWALHPLILGFHDAS